MRDISRGAFMGTLLGASQLAVAAGKSNQVGVGKPGETAFEFVGTITQNGADMAMTGYLTSISGLAETQLFSDPTIRSQSTARFALKATGQMTTRNVLPPLFVLDAVSTTDITFISTPPFGSELSVLTASSKLQTVVHVTSPFTAQSPGKGLFSASGEFVCQGLDDFEIGGVTYHFAKGDQLMRITMVGDGTLTDPAGPISTINVAGSVILANNGSSGK